MRGRTPSLLPVRAHGPPHGRIITLSLSEPKRLAFSVSLSPPASRTLAKPIEIANEIEHEREQRRPPSTTTAPNAAALSSESCPAIRPPCSCRPCMNPSRTMAYQNRGCPPGSQERIHVHCPRQCTPSRLVASFSLPLLLPLVPILLRRRRSLLPRSAADGRRRPPTRLRRRSARSLSPRRIGCHPIECTAFAPRGHPGECRAIGPT